MQIIINTLWLFSLIGIIQFLGLLDLLGLYIEKDESIDDIQRESPKLYYVFLVLGVICLIGDIHLIWRIIEFFINIQK